MSSEEYLSYIQAQYPELYRQAKDLSPSQLRAMARKWIRSPVSSMRSQAPLLTFLANYREDN